MNSSLKFVRGGAILQTRLARCDVLAEHATALLEFERMGVDVCSPPPSEFLRTVDDLKAEIIADDLVKLMPKVRDKVDLAATIAGRLGPVNRAILQLKKYAEYGLDPGALRAVDRGLKGLRHVLQYEDFLERARKAEFKKQAKKALDIYYDALYFVQHGDANRQDVDNDVRLEEVTALEEKVSELGGEVP